MKIIPPKKAYILAAGYGTRLRPLTNVISKPMLPVGGRPVLEQLFEKFYSWGVREVLVNCHHRADTVFSFISNYKKLGMKINLSYEADILGTGGALQKAKWFFDDEPIWLVNGDIVFDLNPDFLLKKFTPDTLSVLWFHDQLGPRTVEIENEEVVNFRSKHSGTKGTYTFCGLHLISSKILDYIPESGFAGIIPAYEQAMQDGHIIKACCVKDTYWSDIGTPENYVKTNHERRSYSMPVDEQKLTYLEQAALYAIGWDASKTNIIDLPVRGSGRSYSRLKQKKHKAILVRDLGERLENKLVAGHTKLLTDCGVSVPKILFNAPEDKFMILQDLGNYSLLQAINRRDSKGIEKLYQKIIDDVIVFHEQGIKAVKRKHHKLMPRFNKILYNYEHDLYEQYFLRMHLDMPDKKVKKILNKLKQVEEKLLKYEPVLVHRDLQSTNIMLQNGKPYFIDYQGMRIGPAAYDLASLLCDPYVMLSESIQLRLLDYYAMQCNLSKDVIYDQFWWAAMQRLIQALGAYGRLGHNVGIDSFLEYIKPASRMLVRAQKYTKLSLC